VVDTAMLHQQLRASEIHNETLKGTVANLTKQLDAVLRPHEVEAVRYLMSVGLEMARVFGEKDPQTMMIRAQVNIAAQALERLDA
jgi:hypothetical protein